MLKEFLWEAFQRTGNIEAYVMYKEIEERTEREKEKGGVREDVLANA